MIKKIALAALLALMGGVSHGQAGAERAARKNMEKGHWDKARIQLRKSLARDTVNASAEFLLTKFFLNRNNPSFHIDSAYLHVHQALKDLGKATPKERDRLNKIAIDSSSLVSLRSAIDSAAFERAKRINTEASFLYFLKAFPTAAQREEAVGLRDEAAFLDAVRENTYQGYFRYFEKYPDASHAAEARAKYHLLLFESKTSSKTLQSYEQFLLEYPSTPYRYVAEKNIFEIYTASGGPEDFRAYLGKFPGSAFATRARNILFHLTNDGESVPDSRFFTDSLLNVYRLNQTYLVPVLRDGKFGFMDPKGNIVIPPRATTIPDEYKCGAVDNDVLIADHQLIGRDGTLIFRDPVENVLDLGFGFLRIRSGNCFHVIHKSGLKVDPCVEDAKILSGRFIALRKQNGWSIHALTGKLIIPKQWDEVSHIGEVLVLKKDGKFLLSTAKTMTRPPVFFSDPYDEVRPWSKNLIWVRSGATEGLVDQSLKTMVPLEDHRIRPAFFGAIVSNPSGVRIFSNNKLASYKFAQADTREPWLAVSADSTWRLFNPVTHDFIGQAYDTITFTGPFAAGLLTDSIHVFLTPSLRLVFQDQAKISFVPGKDSAAFLLVQLEKKKSIWSVTGQKFFTAEYDDIQYAGEGLFIVTKKEKKGLVSLEGKTILPFEYDAIGTVSNRTVSVLRNMKFGVYDLTRSRLIRPQYEKNLIVYRHDLLAAYQNGKYGFIGWDNKPSGRFEFDEIERWDDTIALVRKNFHQALYNTVTHRIVEDQISDIEYLSDGPAEKLAVVKQENAYGVLSNRDGFVIPPSFTNLSNLGTTEEPLYFTEKHVEEASIYVVIYYDGRGKMLFRQVYEENDYGNMVCPDQ